MTSWFKEVFGREPGAPRIPPILRLEEGKTYVVEVEDKNVRVVDTKVGRRPVITVKHEGQEYTLWLSHVDLAEKIALIEAEHSSLRGLKISIKRLPKSGRMYEYEVSVVGTEE